MASFDIRRIDDAAHAAGADVERALLASLSRLNPQGRNESIVLTIAGADGGLVGGLTGSTSYGWLLVKALWVADARRGAGLGRRLMRRAEEEARRAGCHAAWLDTSSRDARAFYLALGYEDFGVLGNAPGQHPEGHRRWFMKKAL